MNSAPAGERGRRFLQLGLLPAIAALVIGLLAASHIDLGRISGELRRFPPDNFLITAAKLQKILLDYGHEQAYIILFFGSLAIIPVKYFVKLGVFLIPLAYAFSGRRLRSALSTWGVLPWAFLTHFMVLCVFVLDMFFLAGRYIAPLLLFSAPLVGIGFAKLVERFPRAKWPMIAGTLIIMLSNVISTGAPKHHFVQAGEWLAQQGAPRNETYVDDQRIAYYADWRTWIVTVPPERIPDHIQANGIKLIAIAGSRKSPHPLEALVPAQYRLIKRFDNGAGSYVLILVPVEPPSH